MNRINKQPLYIKGDYALIARYNKFDDCVEIADINEPQEGWTDYDPTQGDLFPHLSFIIEVVKQPLCSTKNYKQSTTEKS